jgi:hypothetical protein
VLKNPREVEGLEDDQAHVITELGTIWYLKNDRTICIDNSNDLKTISAPEQGHDLVSCVRNKGNYHVVVDFNSQQVKVYDGETVKPKK